MKQIKRITVLVNPTAGSNVGAKVWAAIAQRCNCLLAEYDLNVIETKSKADSVELGATLATDLIISVGGDGTVHDVAQGILARPLTERPVISVLPIGSGNDYSKTLGISSHPQTAIEQLAQGVRIASDVGKCNDSYFLETLSFGVDAAIAINTVDLRKTTKARGTVLYAHAAVLAILRDLKANHVRLTIDGQYEESDLLICAVQNGITYGSGFKVAPRALITDGKLNVCTATHANSVKALYSMLHMKNGSHERINIFRTCEARSLTLDFDNHTPAQCDGEEISGTNFAVHVMPAALDVIVPQNSPVLKGV